MHDHIVKGVAAGSVRIFAAVTTQLVEEGRRRHDCYPVAAAALGRTMTGALLLAADLKTQERITIRIAGDGPIGEVIADADGAGTVRGYVKQPQIDLPLREGKLDVAAAVGNGNIHVTRFTGMKQPFTGNASLVSGEIAEDITHYLYSSEQTLSSVALGVLVNPDATVAAAGGFFIQVMPGAEEGVITQVEKNLAALAPISSLVKTGLAASDIIQHAFAGLEYTIQEEQPLAFRCTCSRDKVSNMLISLGREELEDMANEEEAEIICHFCAEAYAFKREELQCLIDEL
ncbi:Hsp33 family molecular chaperone HslO [Azotosporobacter soli]|uniref:Hsp33 family molecular chaperone HslO n=1 Tax=Azotosporobacter soli TaxID=3055040 RepID=UPI0031FE8F47